METLEQVQARHRKELRDLQAKVTQKKKQATKKTRKGVNDECEQLEQQLRDKQQQELAASEVDDDAVAPQPQDESAEKVLSSKAPTSSIQVVGDITDDLQKTTISTNTEAGEAASAPKKRNRQKDRLARRAAEQEAAATEAEKEAAKLPNWKRQERSAMLKAFQENRLVEKEIQPDGHCMFSAIADQLAQLGISLGAESENEKSEGERYKAVRKAAARYIEGHPDDFSGFLDEPLGSYVEKIRNTAEWGGHLELIALSRNYNIEICVLQDGRTDRFSPDEHSAQDLERIWLAYYHHGYGLGEHYNSLRKAP